MNGYSKKEYLKTSYEEIRKGVAKLPKDYKLLTWEEITALKKAVSTVNNVITLSVTELFVDFLRNKNIIGEEQYQEIKKQIENTKPNANGYDIEYNGDPRIVAEVKCNIPVNGDSFGAAQRTGIIEDIESLQNGKGKSSITNTEDYYKFMVVLSDKDNNVKKAMRKIISERGNIEEYNGQKVKADKVYIVYITPQISDERV